MAEAVRKKPAQQFVARSSWKGQITFGLVSVPIKVYGATQSRDVSFNQVSKVDGSRIRSKKIRESDGVEVDNAEVGKGYQYTEGQYVMVTDEELEQFKAKLKGVKSLDIVEFVPEPEIDPVMLDKAYYLAPEHEAASKAYALLSEAMLKEKVVGIAKFVMSNKEHMALIRVRDGILQMQTLFWPDEVKVPAFEVTDSEVTPEELKMARTLVKGLKSDALDQSKYHDEYRESLLGFIAAKAEGKMPTEVAIPEVKRQQADVMEALRASVEAMQAEAV